MKASQSGLRDGDDDKYGRRSTTALNVRFWGRLTPKRIVLYVVSLLTLGFLVSYFWQSSEE
jgi:hypothetical protein